MQNADGTYWKTDETLFAALPGGREVIDWFGFAPSFHDATVHSLDITQGSAVLRLNAFRMTSEVDEQGYYVLDRHARVEIRLSGLSALTLMGEACPIVSELGIRRLAAIPPEWGPYGGPNAGDFEVALETTYGFEGALFAKDVAFGLIPGKAQEPA